MGENFRVSLPAWAAFAAALPATAVAFLYVSEHHLGATDLKQRMRDAIRANRGRAHSWSLSSQGPCEVSLSFSSRLHLHERKASLASLSRSWAGRCWGCVT